MATESWAVRASTAVFGFSVAIALAPSLQLPARPDDMVSALQAAGYSPRGLILQFAAGVLLTAGFAILGERVARLLAGYRWAATSYCAALLLAPVALMFWGNLRHVVLLGAAAAVVVAVRRRDPRFERGDVVLIPAVLFCYIAFLDLGFGRTPLAAFLRALIAVFFLRVIVAGPFVASRVRGVLYPVIVFVYPLVVLTMPPPTAANFFEDSHNVPVAAEMLRGERPYTDVVPTHGLVSDALLDFAAMKAGVRSLRTILEVRLVVGVLSAVAIYCLVLAATGSGEAGLLAAFLTFSLFPGAALWLRPSAALFALAAAVAGTRLRSRRWFIAAGVLSFVAWLVSLDFGLYAFIVALFAAFRARALRPFLLGIAAAAVPSLLLFAVFGFAGSFVRGTFGEILGGHGAYFSKLLSIPDCLRSPALLHNLTACLNPLMWVVAFITTCAALARSPFRSRRGDGPWLIGVWIVVAAASFVERGNFHFNPAVAPFIVAGLWTMARYARTVAIVLAVAVVLLAEPFRHALLVIPDLRKAPPPGAMFDPTVTASTDAARRFASTLGPGETFVDFSNSALLYPLLGLDLPLRHVEVANYQPEEAQREVIARIEGNSRIAAALITFPGSNQAVDGIPNPARAPLVWEYLQRNFTPAFEENGVVFWRRVE